MIHRSRSEKNASRIRALAQFVGMHTLNNASDYYFDEEDEDGETFSPTISVTNSALYAIAQYCPHLRSLNINSGDPLTYDSTGLDAIIQGCPCLQVIYMDDKVYYTCPGYYTDPDPAGRSDNFCDTDTDCDSDLS